MLHQFFRGAGLSFLEYHYGAGLLSPFGVGNGDDGALLHRRMGIDGILHLLGGDVLAAPDDEIVAPARQVEVALLIHIAHITGTQPSILSHGLGRLLSILPMRFPTHLRFHLPLQPSSYHLKCFFVNIVYLYKLNCFLQIRFIIQNFFLNPPPHFSYNGIE